MLLPNIHKTSLYVMADIIGMFQNIFKTLLKNYCYKNIFAMLAYYTDILLQHQFNHLGPSLTLLLSGLFLYKI